MDVHVQMEGHMRTQKKVAICEPRQEVSEETKLGLHLGLAFSRTVRN